MQVRTKWGGALVLAVTAASVWAEPPEEAAVGRVLDGLHSAAAAAEGERYFSLFAEDATFIGTDAGERWTLAEFRDYARPHFEKGRGWTYTPTERQVTLGPEGNTAWFSELLDNDKYGLARGTGVLVRTDDGWKIAQYHLAFPIPNELSGEVTERIREWREANEDPP